MLRFSNHWKLFGLLFQPLETLFYDFPIIGNFFDVPYAAFLL